MLLDHEVGSCSISMTAFLHSIWIWGDSFWCMQGGVNITNRLETRLSMMLRGLSLLLTLSVVLLWLDISLRMKIALVLVSHHCSLNQPIHSLVIFKLTALGHYLLTWCILGQSTWWLVDRLTISRRFLVAHKLLVLIQKSFLKVVVGSWIILVLTDLIVVELRSLLWVAHVMWHHAYSRVSFYFIQLL